MSAPPTDPRRRGRLLPRAALAALLAAAAACSEEPADGAAAPADRPRQEAGNPDALVRPPAAPPPEPARIAFTPPTVALEVVDGAAPTAPQLVSAANVGRSPAEVASVQRVGPDVLVLETDCQRTLQPGAACRLRISLSPAAAGAAVRAGVVLGTADGQSFSLPVDVSVRTPARPAAPAPAPAAPAVDAEALARAERERRLAAARSARVQAAAPAAVAFGEPVQALGDGGELVARPRSEAVGTAYPDTPRYEASAPVDVSRAILASQPIRLQLWTPIDTERCGEVRAKVWGDVYGGDGRTVVLPAWSDFIGDCQSLVREGETRVPVRWRRIIRSTDNAQFLIDEQASDRMGRTGLVGDLNRRIPERLFATFLTTLVDATVAGVGAVLDDSRTTTVVGDSGRPVVIEDTTRRGRLAADTARAISQGLGSSLREVIDDYYAITPAITVAAGEIVVVVPSTDLWLADPGTGAAAGRVLPLAVDVLGGASLRAAPPPSAAPPAGRPGPAAQPAPAPRQTFPQPGPAAIPSAEPRRPAGQGDATAPALPPGGVPPSLLPAPR
jgi:type IV secretion system protein VirB10